MAFDSNGLRLCQEGANLAEGCKPGRRVQTWQKGANLAEGCKPGRRVQTWQKGANLAEGCKGAESGYPPCTFAPFARPNARHLRDGEGRYILGAYKGVVVVR